MTSLSTKRFKNIYRLTEAFCKIDPSIKYDSIVQNKLDRWAVLVDIWDANKKKFRGNVFTESIFRVFHGRYASFKTKNVVALQNEITEALINDQDAFYMWSQTLRFRNAFRTIIKKTILPKIEYLHTHYVCSQGLHRLFYGKTVSDKAKNLLKEFTGFEMSELDHYKNDYAFVRPRLEKVLPQVYNWTDEQCCNIEAICVACNNTHGTRLYRGVKYYDPIFRLQDYKEWGKSHYSVFMNAKLNYNVANAIFGQDTDTALNDIFQDAYNNLTDSPGQGQLINSWIFDIVNTWAHDKTHPYHDLVKKPVFDVNMRAI